ncbi:MAG: diaminopimelate decarboxylase [Atopostipes suicloacalis]|nr:diaminopimelate decarboxylase [Atopostipes suicloacalis]
MNKEDHLEIAGVDTIDLAEKYGTPLMIYDIKTVRNNISEFKKALNSYPSDYEISYASKAFSSLAMYQVLNQENISVDVVSGGELQLAKESGFPAEKINFHGNNKSYQELIEALDYKIGHIIVDNFHELEMLEQLTKKRNQKMKVIIRVTPGVTADTHKYIMTGHTDSKFGFDLKNGQAEQAVRIAKKSSNLELSGLHMHIGSQIFGTESYVLAMDQVLRSAKEWYIDFGFQLKVLNIGGGFGIQHTPDDEAVSVKRQVKAISDELVKLLNLYDLEYPILQIEPGRSIVGTAGTTIYEIGSKKNIPGLRDYISIDGGMSDNIRPAMYNSKYFASLANRMKDERTTKVSVAGKACESGDMLIMDLDLPKARAGDKLAVFHTGDYAFAMASNYNRIPRPAVVFVENGKEFVSIRREEVQDFMRFENHLPKDF